MSDTRYLPVRVAGHNYLIAMDIVLSVQPIATSAAPTSVAAKPDTTEPDQEKNHGVPMVALDMLLGAAAPETESQYAIIVATPAGSCALLVDTVRSPVNAQPDAVRPLPFLLTLTECPFSALVSMRDDLLPVLNITRLLEHLRRVKPELVTEAQHAR